MAYVRIYKGLRGLPSGLYKIGWQDKRRRIVVLERVGRVIDVCKVTTDCLEHMLNNEQADISQTPLR